MSEAPAKPAGQATSNAAGQGTGPGTGAARGPVASSPGAFRITGLSDPQRNRWFKFLVYGPPGVGKTTLTGSSADVPEMCDVLFVSIEAGELALEENERITNVEGIDIIRMTQIEQLQKLLEFLKVHCAARDRNDEMALAKLQAQVFGTYPLDKLKEATLEQLQEANGRIRKYRTVIIDSLSEIEGQNLAKLQGLDNDKQFEVGQIEVAGWGEFRQNNHTIQRIVRAFRDLPINLMLICAQAWQQDEMKKFHYAPALTGKLSGQVQGFVDVVGYLVISQAATEVANAANKPNANDVRRLYVQPQAGVKFDAKNRRSSYKKPFFDNPVMSDMMLGFGLIKR